MARTLRRIAVLAAASLVALGVPAANRVASAAGTFFEDFESGLGAWSVIGATASTTCSHANTGSCSLQLAPACCAAYVLISRAVNVPLGTAARLVFSYWTDSGGGDVDSAIRLRLDSGEVSLTPTDYSVSGSNAGVRLFSAGFGDSGSFAAVTPQAWNEIVIDIDTVNDRVSAQVNGGAKAALAISPAATIATHLEFDSVAWAVGDTPFYDSVVVGEPRTECSDTFDNDGDGRLDHPSDTGCSSPGDDTESPNPACSNGVDDDLDGAVDYPADAACRDEWDATESVRCPPVAGVTACLEGSQPFSTYVVTQPTLAGPEHDVAGYIDRYRFTVAGVTSTLACVVMRTDAGVTNPCASAGGTFDSRLFTIAELAVDGPATSTLLTVRICRAELTVIVAGIGVNSAPAYTLC